MSNAQHEALRAWAKGIYALEAATELLIRGFGGKFAQPGNPWVGYDPTHGSGSWWIEFEKIPEETGALSGGERRFLDLVASLGADVPVAMGDILSGMDRTNLVLAMAAMSHASGAHEHSGLRISEDGQRMIRDSSLTGALVAWP
jgi:hypothetical protein